MVFNLKPDENVRPGQKNRADRPQKIESGAKVDRVTANYDAVTNSSFRYLILLMAEDIELSNCFSEAR
ncbi:hypothetical protein NBRC116495_12730 [Aurantivibrio plasticivorans]